MLFTGCILMPSQASCFRVSIMSRHTLNDGVTPDVRLIGAYEEHWPLLGPSPSLIGSYYKHGLEWDYFKKKYLVEISSGAKSEQVDSLIELAGQRDVVVLCIEAAPWRCHRFLLAQECQRRNSKLPILIA